MTHKIDKKIILSFIIACTVLCLTKSMFFNWKSKLSIWTNVKEDTNISVEYRRKETSPLNHVKIEKQVNGKFVLKLRGNKTSYVKINVPKNVQIEKVRYSGLKSKDIILDKSKSAQLENYLARPHIDFYNLIVIFVVSFYFTWFLFNAWEHRHDPKEPEKIPSMMNIEFLRIIFTLGVVYCHFGDTWKFYIGQGTAVEFFFVLSGFLLTYTFKSEKSVIDFMKAKIIRFFPLILFCGLIRGIFTNNFNLNNFLSDLLFLPVPGLNQHIGYVNVAWYISVLFWVSLFYFYLIKYYRKENVRLAIGLVVFFSFTALVSFKFGTRDSINYFIKTNLLRGLASMGLGYFLAIYYNEVKDKNILNKNGYNFIEIVVFFYSIFGLWFKSIRLSNTLYLVISFAILILYFVRKQGYLSKFFEKKVFTKFSKYCLAIYLCQGITVYSLFGIFKKNYMDYVMSHPQIIIPCIFFITIIIGIFAHHAIEKPGAKLMKRWLE